MQVKIANRERVCVCAGKLWVDASYKIIIPTSLNVGN